MKRKAILMVILLVPAAVVAQSLISVQQEIEIGKELQQQVRSQVPEITDRQITAYISNIGGRLAAQAPGEQYPYTFSVADFADINAFALPGGPVWVNRGTIEAAQTEAQLASVLGHEIAHIAQRHAAERLTKAVVAEGILGLLGAVVGQEGAAQAANIGARLLAGGLFLRFSRDDEREADRVGAEILHRAGWDGRGSVEFMQILREQQQRDPSSVEVFFSSHPSPENRIGLLEETTRDMRGGQRDSEEFQQIRRRIAGMPPAQPTPRPR